MNPIASIVGAFALLFATTASAQGYFGGSLGQSDYDDDITSGLITSGSVDGSDTGFKIFGGYRFTPHVGAELALVNFGTARYSGDFFGTPVTGGKIDVWGYNVSAVLSFPLGQRASVFGKLGLFLWESEVNDVTGGAPFGETVRGWDGGSFGIGAAWSLAHRLSARVEWELFPIGSSDARLFSVGLQYNF